MFARFSPKSFLLGICTLGALMLSACGGGATTSTPVAATEAGADRAQAAAVRRVQSGTAASPDGWALCAKEGGRCSFDGTRSVRYGVGSAVVTKSLTGGAECNNQTFGDPKVGTQKSCWFEMPAVDNSPSDWTACAQEGAVCTFVGKAEVRYGAAESYVTRLLSSPVDCTNQTFGDPLVGTGKSCSVAVATAPPAADPCEVLPALPSLPASYNVVTSFCPNGKCARPDDDVDDTDAIDAALNASAGKFLVFPPGKYLISRSLRVKQSGVTLWGPGATIHATNSDDQSIIIEANNTSIYSFRLTAVTGERGSRAEHTRIAIYGPVSVNPIVKNSVIRNNEIVNAGAPGTDLANSATGAGIFVQAADGFLIAGNTVARSLADGIHVTGGARNGRIVGNTVRETGDDMIALVSYAYPNPWTNTAATISPNFAANMDIYEDSNILIANNVLSGQYWGRGIAVVGGQDVTIRGNTLNNIPYAAGILLARETQSGSFGLDNILVEKNALTDIQTLTPPYDFENKFATHSRTGHGAVEIEASMFLDELAMPALKTGLRASTLTVRNNTITASATPGVRIGVGTGSNWTMGSRQVTGNAPFDNLSITSNAMSDIRNSSPVQMLAAGSAAACSANTLAGAVFSTAACTAKAPVVATGAHLSCPK